MTLNRGSTALFLRVGLILAVCGAFAAPAWAQAPDLSGSWLGTFKVKGEKGPDSKGVIGFDFTQAGSDGTLTGLATTRGTGIQTSFDGFYAMSGRKITGTITAYPPGDPADTGPLEGKCNKKVKKIKLKVFSSDGTQVKIKLLKLPF